MEWTDEQVNELLANLGLRTPGQEPPENPERIVAVALLDAQARIRELTGKVLESVTLYERARTEIDRLVPIEAERNELAQAAVVREAAAMKLLERIEVLTRERDQAFKMMQQIEIRVRTLQAQVDAAHPGGGQGQGQGQGQGGGRPT